MEYNITNRGLKLTLQTVEGWPQTVMSMRYSLKSTEVSRINIIQSTF